MKLLVDMNLSPRWVDLLTRSQFEAVHWSSVGSPHALDQEIMAYAAKHDYVVVTNDLDFGAILAVTHGEREAERRAKSLRESQPGGDRSGDDQSATTAR